MFLIYYYFFCGAATQRGSWPPHSRGFLDHTQRRATFGRTPLDEWSARRRDLYLTTHNTHHRQTSMPPVGFEPTIALEPLVLPSYRCVRGRAGRPARPRTQHDCHHHTKVNPEAATAVIEHLIMGGKTPETCWAVNKRQDNKLENCCIKLVIYLNCTMMHGLTNLKFYI
jgi:hypothetical protein